MRALSTSTEGVVSRDLAKLAELEVIEYAENGWATVPRLKHSHVVVVEPVV